MIHLYLSIFLSIILYPFIMQLKNKIIKKINKRKIIEKNYINFKNMIENNYLLLDLFSSLKKHNIKNIKEVFIAILLFNHLFVLKKPSF